MKQTFYSRTINSPFEDPLVYVRIVREKRALLFDLGYFGCLDAGDILKISDVFVTHTHMDHFVGFDFLLRSLLRRESPLRIYGPENIIPCVEGKLKGYTWNLIRDYPLKIEVFGIKDYSVSHASFYAENAFERQDNPEAVFNGTLLDDPLFRVRAVSLLHQIQVLAFSLEEKCHININAAALSEMGIPVGPWLSDFKAIVRGGVEELKKMQDKQSDNDIYDIKKVLCHLSPRNIRINDKSIPIADLHNIAIITRGQKISYVTDISPTDENIEKIIPFVKGSDTLFIEAYFLDSDIGRARERHHLTALLAGRIGREAGVGDLEILHFSPKYRHCPDELYKEAVGAFKRIF